LFFMSYPQTALTIKTINGPVTLDLGLNVWVFTALLFVVGIAWGFGKASVFKFLSDEYPDNIGVISGIVGLAGGMGGFLLPIMFGAMKDLTGVNSTVFMLLYGATCVSLIWMHYTFAKEHQEQDMEIAKEHAVDEYVKNHECPEEYAAAKAAVEQAHLLEELIEKYTESKEKAKLEADAMHMRQVKASKIDTLE
ncbi:MAG: MFS transporter, partial [Sedimenticola sp.]|nr:MFS transporter [Sedimenticola sp.]